MLAVQDALFALRSAVVIFIWLALVGASVAGAVWLIS
jgi:hypothetical protein